MWGVSCLKEKNTFFVTDFTVIWHGWLLRSLILNTFSYFICNCYCKITAFRVSYLQDHEVKNVFFVDLEIQVFRKRSMATITAFWISTLNNSRTSFLMQVCKTFLFSFLFFVFFPCNLALSLSTRYQFSLYPKESDRKARAVCNFV